MILLSACRSYDLRRGQRGIASVVLLGINLCCCLPIYGNGRRVISNPEGTLAAMGQSTEAQLHPQRSPLQKTPSCGDRGPGQF